MLIVITHQMAAQIIRVIATDDTIELAEFNKELKEEIESEDKLISIRSFQSETSNLVIERSLIHSPSQSTQLDVNIKIPVPPPELV